MFLIHFTHQSSNNPKCTLWCWVVSWTDLGSSWRWASQCAGRILSWWLQLRWKDLPIMGGAVTWFGPIPYKWRKETEHQYATIPCSRFLYCGCCVSSCPQFLLLWHLCHDELTAPWTVSWNKPLPVKDAFERMFYYSKKHSTLKPFNFVSNHKQSDQGDIGIPTTASL